MPTITPYVPQRITVHLGAPNSNAENVTVSFSDYVKNVASSEPPRKSIPPGTKALCGQIFLPSCPLP